MEFIVPDNCLICSRKFEWNETTIIKTPEWATFCIKCAAEYPDPKVYDKDIECWLVHCYRWQEKYEYS